MTPGRAISALSGQHPSLIRDAPDSAKKRILVIGAGPSGRKFADAVIQSQANRYVVLGFLDDEIAPDGDVLGPLESLAEIARATFADEIVIAIASGTESTRQAVREARRLKLSVKLVPDLLGFEPLTWEMIGGIPVLTLHEEVAPKIKPFVKRAIDVLLCVTSMLLAIPLMAAVAISIKLDSAGPILYKAPRVGKRGRYFACYKFRSMVADADGLKGQLRSRNQRDGAFFKMEDDPRITRVGRFLRRYSLDELPQLINVLRGEMSLVGPRPHPLDDFERYQVQDLRRLDVVPGMTGLWQVTARRDPSFQRNMALDLEYIEGWNLALDLRILIRTITTVLQGTGA